ncbi:MAG: hypothetical protein AAGF13_02260 [Pseudomonadota bacterium]
MGGQLDTRWVFLGGFVAVLVILFPFSQALYLPLTDLPNHMARHAIMAADEGSALAQYYSSQFVLVPNSAADILWALFGSAGQEIEFSHRLMAFSAVNLLIAAMVLARVIHGRWTWWSLAGGLLAFNATFFYGFQNYVVSVPFAIYAFALYLAIEDRPVWLRALLFALVTPALFLMHFFAFAVLGVLAFGREAQRLVEANGNRMAALGRGSIMGLPFLIPVFWLVASMASGPENPAGSFTEFGTLSDRLNRFITPLYSWATDLTTDLNGSGMAILAFLYVIFFTVFIRAPLGLALAPRMRGPILALLGATLLAPNWLSGVAFIDIRFPFVLIVVFIAATDLLVRSRAQGVAIMVCILAVLGMRSTQISDWWRIHDAEIRDAIAVMEENLEPGDRVIPVRGQGAFADSRFWHVQGYATAVSEAFIPTLFLGVHAVQLRKEWHDHATAAMHANPTCALFDRATPESAHGPTLCHAEPYTQAWSTKFNKVLAMEPLAPEITAGEPVRLIASRGRFELYEVLN